MFQISWSALILDGLLVGCSTDIPILKLVVGGKWVLDALTDLQPGQKPSEQIWGCYKPNAPRENVDKPGKKIK